MVNLATTASFGTSKTMPYAEHWGLNGADASSHIGIWNTPEFLTAMGALPMPLLRYAGGTSANTWRWRRSATDSSYGGYSEGVTTDPVAGGPRCLTLGRFKQICDASGAVPVWCLNFACDSTAYGRGPSWAAKLASTGKYGEPNLTDQMLLLSTANGLGLPIKYVELGSEFASLADTAVKVNYNYPPEGKSTLNPATGVNYTALEIPYGYVYDRLAPVTSNVNGENEEQLVLGYASTLTGTAYPGRSDVPTAGGAGYLYGKRAGIWCAAIKAIYPSAKVIVHVPGNNSQGLGSYNKRYWVQGMRAGLPTSGSGVPDIIVMHPYHDGNNNYTYVPSENTPPPSIDPTQPGYSQTVVDNYLAGAQEKWDHLVGESLTSNPGTDKTLSPYWYSLKDFMDGGMSLWMTEYGFLDNANVTTVPGLSYGVDGGTGGWGQILSNITATLVRYNHPYVTGMTLHSLQGSKSSTGAIVPVNNGLTAKAKVATINGSAYSYPDWRYAGQHELGPSVPTVPYYKSANGYVTAIMNAFARGGEVCKPMAFSGSPKINDTGAAEAGVVGTTFTRSGGATTALVVNLRAAAVDITLPSALASSAYVIHSATNLSTPIIAPSSIASATGTLGSGSPVITLPAYTVLRVNTVRTSAQMVADLAEPGGPPPTVQTRMATYAEATALATAAPRIYPAFSMSGNVSVTTGTFRFYVEEAWTIVAVRASVGTAPTGSSMIIDVKKSGTSIFATNTSHRPTIGASANTALAGSADTTALTSGSYLTVDVLQVGSTVPGANLTVQVELAKA